ncbi:protein tyrosine kinase [Fragilaria crotonensis]|nr:protein tyrosine kinase [Fragilaria crotonensis]
MQIDASQTSDNSFSHGDLMRLHRRAKARFSLLDNTSTGNEEEVLQIWLSYAEAQAKYASPEEARAVYRLIQNQGFGAKLSSFYVSFAKFESNFNVSRAIDVINSGIENGAEPIEILRTTLMKLDQLDKKVDSSQRESLVGCAPSGSPLQGHAKRVSLVPPLPTESRKRARRQAVSPKGRAFAENHETDEKAMLEDSNMSAGTVSLSLENELKTVSRDGPSSLSRQVMSQNHTAEAGVVELEFKSAAISQKEGTAQSNPSANDAKAAAKKTRNRLLSKVPRLKPVGLTGGAKRLTPEEINTLSDSDDEKSEPQVVQSGKSKAAKDSNTKPKVKVSRIDLSYMMNWDPSRRGSLTSANPTGEQSDSLVLPATIAKCHEPKLGALPESTEPVSRSSVVTSSSHATSTASSQTGRSARTDEVCDSEDKPELTNNDIPNDGAKTAEAVLPETAKLLGQCNTDFLPLVNENNIIRVNDVPFVKLGVIGKGGSSKVYRVLSKSCCVLAIKKVKLGNLDQKAIDGYANEIALLKKLQGNPSIIQMHDSEIDLSRKAIFLAMEVGEVDLNHVLQQQTLQSTKKGNTGYPSLNMNFIRLTWQQMLSAVHSIHEERIIHSDLKPANFLFVRGALKLIDFGIAKAIQTDDTTNIYRDSQIGTLNYMSPEAILDTGSGDGAARMRIGRASDIWSLGCILYQMVFGRTPFASLHMIQKLQAIVNPSHKIEFPGDVDEAAVDAIKRCLRRNPDDRPPIVGKNGLLNEHFFLNHHRAAKGS